MFEKISRQQAQPKPAETRLPPESNRLWKHVAEIAKACSQNYLLSSSVAHLSNGYFLVLWETFRHNRSSVCVQLFKGDGTLEGEPLTINSSDVNYFHNSSVAPLLDGGFMATWYSWGEDRGCYGQHFNIMGDATSKNIEIPISKGRWRTHDAIVPLSDGGFMIAGRKEKNNWNNISFQHFNMFGQKTSKVLNLSSSFEEVEELISIAPTLTGDMLVTWNVAKDGLEYVQHFDAAGRSSKGKYWIDFRENGGTGYIGITTLLDGTVMSANWDGISHSLELHPLVERHRCHNT